MKASKKIIIIAGVLIVVLLVISMVVIRNDIQLLGVKSEREFKYQTVPVDQFERLDFSANWVVRISQGREYKVELSVDGNSGWKPSLDNMDGTLYFKGDSIEHPGIIRARVTAPFLQSIKAMRGTKIRMEDFKVDSLSLILENGSAFIGNNNNFKFVNFKTSGEVSLQLTKDDL